MVNPQVSLLNLTFEAGIPVDVMWSLIDGKHIVSVPHHDGLFVDSVDDCLDEDIEGGTEDLFYVGEDNPVKEDGGQRRTSFCPAQSVVSDFGAPQSHAIKD